jgi:hypothetical protein
MDGKVTFTCSGGTKKQEAVDTKNVTADAKSEPIKDEDEKK